MNQAYIVFLWVVLGLLHGSAIAQSIRFIHLNAQGQPTDTAAHAHCVLDNKTKLIWEIKDPQIGLRYFKHQYSWFDPTQNEAAQGIANGAESMFCHHQKFCNTQAYQQLINQTKLCGFNQWRLPTLNELKGLIMHKKTDPLVNTTIFPHTALGSYWTSSPGDQAQLAFDVPFFAGGMIGQTEKIFALHVRLTHNWKD